MVSGTANGEAVDAVDSFGFIGTEMQQGIQVSYTGVAIANKPNACSIAQANANIANGQVLLIAAAASGTSVPAGSYPINSTTEAIFESSNGTCVSSSETATSGTITFTTVTGSEVAGSFDVTFGSGDHLTGHFSAPICGVTLDQLSATNTGACMQSRRRAVFPGGSKGTPSCFDFATTSGTTTWVF